MKSTDHIYVSLNMDSMMFRDLASIFIQCHTELITELL